MKACGQYQEAEALLYIFTQLDCELSHDANRNTIEAQSTVYVMSHLASCLRRQGRYGDSAAVLVATERRFKDLICFKNASGRIYYRQKANLLRVEGQLLESEEILRGILNHVPDHSTMDKSNALAYLVDLSTETGRQEEAARRYSSTMRKNTGLRTSIQLGAARNWGMTIQSLAGTTTPYISFGKRLRSWLSFKAMGLNFAMHIQRNLVIGYCGLKRGEGRQRSWRINLVPWKLIE
jgi:tetratricopeptide (TPR) repeat protein